MRQTTCSPAAALGGWVAKGWMTEDADVNADNDNATQTMDNDADNRQ